MMLIDGLWSIFHSLSQIFPTPGRSCVRLLLFRVPFFPPTPLPSSRRGCLWERDPNNRTISGSSSSSSISFISFRIGWFGRAYKESMGWCGCVWERGWWKRGWRGGKDAAALACMVGCINLRHRSVNTVHLYTITLLYGASARTHPQHSSEHATNATHTHTHTMQAQETISSYRGFWAINHW